MKIKIIKLISVKRFNWQVLLSKLDTSLIQTHFSDRHHDDQCETEFSRKYPVSCLPYSDKDKLS